MESTFAVESLNNDTFGSRPTVAALITRIQLTFVGFRQLLISRQSPRDPRLLF